MNPTAPPAMLEKLGGAMARAMGTRRSNIMAGMFLVYVAVNLFSSFIDELLKHWGPFARPSPLVIVLALFWLWARRARNEVKPVVLDQTANVQPCRVLILFLSPPGQDKPEIPKLIGDPSTQGRISDIALRDRFLGPWRMPLEGIAAHLPHLEKIVIVSSSGPNGTKNVVRLFVDLLGHVLPSPARVEILDATLWLGERCPDGVDFEQVGSLVETLVAIEERLKKVPPHEIMIDITGGKKPSTAAGTVMSLGRGRRFQYVSTEDKTVRGYDVTYEAADE